MNAIICPISDEKVNEKLCIFGMGNGFLYGMLYLQLDNLTLFQQALKDLTSR